MALTKIGATLGGSADVITVTQSSHGLYLGYPVKMTSSGYAHATANTAVNAEAVGIVIATDRTGANTTFSLALGGRVTVDGCVPNLTTGTVLFLQVSAGLLAAAEPSVVNQVSKPMAVITIANSEMIMVQQRGEVVTTGTATIADGSIDNDAMADDAIDTDELLADAVTNAKLANMPTRTVKANATSGSANPTDVVMADGDFLIANASGLVTVPIQGDVVINNAGLATIQATSVENSMLADNAVNSDELAAGAVDLAHMSSESVDEDNLHISNNGNNGEFLSKQSGNPGGLTWAAAGGGKLELIGTAVASGSANLTITGLDSTYDTYLIVLADMVPANDGSNVGIQVGDSSGIDTGGSDYGYHVQNLKDYSDSYSAASSEGSGRILMPGDGSGNGSGEGGGAVLWLHRPADGTTKPTFSGHGTVVVAGGRITGGSIIAERTAVITLDRVLCKMDAGNIATGRMTVWGLAHA